MNITHNTATRPKLSMRFFGAKIRKHKDGQQLSPRQPQQPLASVKEAHAETRTDVTVKKDGQAMDTGRRELSVATQQQQQPQPQVSTPKRRGFSKSPTARPSSRSRGEREAAAAAAAGGIRSPVAAAGSPSPRGARQRGMDNSENSRQRNRLAAPKSTRSSPKQQTSFGSNSTSKTTNNTTTKANKASPKAKSPPSILHRNTIAQQLKLSPPPPPPPSEYSPLPMYNMSHNPRVRFMSSEQSVASTEASNVHLMAGPAGSVASSSAMSSSADRENVFDRVLNMVMAEEHERLNAMGFSGSPDPKSDSAWQAQKASEKKAAKEKFAKADAKAKAVVASVVMDSHSGSDDDLGLMPPSRMDLAPIDIDTGLEIGGSYDAPIDMDTGLEVHHKSPIDMDTGLEVEYHDMNDDEVDEERWKRLNEKALTSGMQGLGLDENRRIRSYDQDSPQSKHHNRGVSSGSDPQRKGSWTAATSPSSTLSSAGGRSSKKSPGGGRKIVGKKTKKFWDKSKDLQSDEWVAFDNQKSPPNNDSNGNNKGKSPGRVSDLAAF